MTQPLFDVFLTGAIQPGQNPHTVADRLAQLTRSPVSKATQMLAGKPVRMKAGVDRTTAEKYVAALVKAGAVAECRPQASAVPAPVVPEPTPAPVEPPARMLELEPLDLDALDEAPFAPQPLQHKPLIREPVAAPPVDLHPGLSLEPIESRHTDTPAPAADAPAATTGDDDEQITCPHCGDSMAAHLARCPHCGGRAPQQGRSKTVAALLALFFTGSMGIHRFYLGQWWGVFYLLLCWTGIPSLVSLVEFIVFLVRDDATWAAQYGHKKPVGVSFWVFTVILALLLPVIIISVIGVGAYDAYKDTVVVTEARVQAQGVQQQVETYWLEHSTAPGSNYDLELEQPLPLGDKATLDVLDQGRILITFTAAAGDLAGQTLTFTPAASDMGFEWQCDGSQLDEEVRPLDCQ